MEVNAYWYNALRIMERFQPLLGYGGGSRYAAMAERARASFREKFWNPELGCLRDVLSGAKADNQGTVWAFPLGGYYLA